MKFWTLFQGEAAFSFRLAEPELKLIKLWWKERWETSEEERKCVSSWSFQPDAWRTEEVTSPLHCSQDAFWKFSGKHKLRLVNIQINWAEIREGQNNLKSLWWPCIVTCMGPLQRTKASPLNAYQAWSSIPKHIALLPWWDFCPLKNKSSITGSPTPAGTCFMQTDVQCWSWVGLPLHSYSALLVICVTGRKAGPHIQVIFNEFWNC